MVAHAQYIHRKHPLSLIIVRCLHFLGRGFVKCLKCFLTQLSVKEPRLKIEFCEFPDDVLYDFENNVWVKTHGAYVELGITSVHAFLAGKLKDVRFRKLEGSKVVRGQSIATIESVKYFGAVRTSLSGTVIEVNNSLNSTPKLVNDSPYREGWFVRLTTTVDEERKRLSDVRDSQELVRSQIRELRVRCFHAYPDYEMWEIGVECAAVLVRLNELMERCVVGDVVHVVSDDPTADIEIVRWSDQTGQEVLESRQEGRLLHLIVKKVHE